VAVLLFLTKITSQCNIRCRERQSLPKLQPTQNFWNRGEIASVTNTRLITSNICYCNRWLKYIIFNTLFFHLPYSKHCSCGCLSWPELNLHVIDHYLSFNSSFKHTCYNFHCMFWQLYCVIYNFTFHRCLKCKNRLKLTLDNNTRYYNVTISLTFLQPLYLFRNISYCKLKQKQTSRSL